MEVSDDNSTTIWTDDDSMELYPVEKAEVLYSFLTLLVGAPLNILAFCQSIKKYRASVSGGRGRKRSGESQAVQLILLTLNLNVTDLLIIFVYLPTRIAWRLTFYWYGGDFLCRFLLFMYQFSFHTSSWAIVCIATERLLTVRNRMVPGRRRGGVKWMIVGAWILCFIFCLPTVFVWQTYYPFNGTDPQCVSTFVLHDYENTTTPGIMMLDHTFQYLSLLTVFWIPAIYIAIVYSYIFVVLQKLGRANFNAQRKASSVATAPPKSTQLEVSSPMLSSCNVSTRLLPSFAEKSVSKEGLTDGHFRKRSMTDSRMPDLSGQLSGVPLTQMNSSASTEFGSTRSEQRDQGRVGKNKTGIGRSQPAWRQRLRSKEIVFNQTGLMVLVFLACWLPYFLSSFAGEKFRFLAFLIGINSAVNPILYAFG